MRTLRSSRFPTSAQQFPGPGHLTSYQFPPSKGGTGTGQENPHTKSIQQFPVPGDANSRDDQSFIDAWMVWDLHPSQVDPANAFEAACSGLASGLGIAATEIRIRLAGHRSRGLTPDPLR